MFAVPVWQSRARFVDVLGGVEDEVFVVVKCGGDWETREVVTCLVLGVDE